MRGTVKWFSQQKGYGFIIGNDNQEYYLHVREVSGTTLPSNGDVVEFSPGQNKRGPTASTVKIVTKAAKPTPAQRKPERVDDRVTCTGCGRKIVPRIITDHGEPSKSVCAFCGTTYQDFGWCFIASAVYGDYDAPEVLVLRRYRDEILLHNALGRKFVRFYYRTSPPIAQVLKKMPMLASCIRALLDKLIIKLRI